MIGNTIIGLILKCYKETGRKHPQNPSFMSNANGDSFYLIRKRNDGHIIQIRISNHGTYLKTWTDRNELSNSTDRVDPSLCTNISIVFIDEDKNLTQDCNGRRNCSDCNIQPCIPQTFHGQNELGKPFEVTQYSYNCNQIKLRYIKGLTKAIVEASVSGEYKDPLSLASQASLTSNKMANHERLDCNVAPSKKMFTTRIKLSELRNIIIESITEVFSQLQNNN